MKKRLLLQLLAIVCTIGAYAYNIGDYLYSASGKFKVISANQVENGWFTEGADGFTGWTDEDGMSVSSENWKISTGLGPNGENVLESLKASKNTRDTEAGEPAIFLTRHWQLNPGTYAISYWIRGNNTANTSVSKLNSKSNAFTAIGTNYINFFKNYDGKADIGAPKGLPTAEDNPNGGTQVSTSQAFSSEWTQIVESVTIEAGEYLVFDACAVEAGVMLTGFEIYEVQEIYDTRILERTVAYINKLLAEESLTEGKDQLAGVLEILKGMLAAPSSLEDKDATTEMVNSSVEEEIANFLELNGGDTESGDWSKRSGVNWNSLNNATIIGSWKTLGDRWGFSPNNGSLERPEGDGYVLSAGIQTSYNHQGKGVMVERTDLKPGKYFFYIEAQAVASANGSQPYGSDFSRPVVGPSIWVGKDTLTMAEDTISGTYWKRYYRIADVLEGDTVRAGFLFPSYDDNKGGRYSLRNPQFRMIGTSTDVLRWELNVRNIITQQTELKKRIDEYPVELTDYKWEQDSLQRAVADANTALANSFLYVKEDGSSDVAQTPDGVEQLNAVYEDLLNNVNAMGRARNWVINTNAIQGELQEWIDKGEASLANEANNSSPEDLRTALKSAISEAKALLANISSVNQTDEFKAAIEKIKEAKLAYEMPSSTRANPAPVTLVNGGFEAWTSDTNYSDSETTREVNGWILYCQADMKQWQIRLSDRYESGVHLNAWRGTTVAPRGKATQKITVTMPGLYEYRVKAYGVDDNLAQFMGVAKEISDFVYDPVEDDEIQITVDTTYYDTPVHVFFGLEGAAAVVPAYKSVSPGENKGYKTAETTIDGYTPWTYSVFYNKTSSEPEILEFGLECVDNTADKGVNGFGFGDNKIFYVGKSVDQYVADTKAELAGLITEGQSLVNQYKEDAVKSFLTYKIKRFINDANNATTAQDLQNAYWGLSEMVWLIKQNVASSDPDGIKTVESNDNVKNAVKQGVYNLQGVKMNGKNLPRGLYIINGKKYVVK